MTNKPNTAKALSSMLYAIALIGGFLHMYNSAFGTISSFQMRPLHLAIIGVLAALMGLLDVGKAKRPALSTVANVAMMLCVVVGVSELLVNYDQIALSAGKISSGIVFCCTLLVIAILYLTASKVGKALPIIAGVLILYALLGHYLPGMLGHRGYSYSRLMYFLYVNGNGIFGTAIDTSARYLVLFMIMGAFIELSGTSKLFMALSDYVSSKLRGGAAKSSVVASALFGTISGTPIANVMVTGAFTIPMMKRSGFDPDFAAGVEATASTGGLIMPPMMGAGAFVMAELLGISYSSIMVAALIPALLYYFSIYLAIDFYAAKKNIGCVREIDIDEVKLRIKTYTHTILPLAAFILCVVMGYSVFRSAIVCIIATPIVAALRKETSMTPKMVLDGITVGMKNTVSLGAACACAGIIIGVISLTGFGFSFAELLSLFRNMPIVALLITMVVCIVMGMGMPAIASYMITATIAASTLVNMGFAPIAVHMFVFFFSCFSSVTPPVALASYSAAGISGSNPMKTGYKAFQLALVAFIVPYFFIYSPALIAQQGWMGVLAVLPAALLGVYAFVSGMHGYLFGVVNGLMLRTLLIASGCLMIVPGIITDMIGLGILIAILAVVKLSRRTRST